MKTRLATRSRCLLILLGLFCAGTAPLAVAQDAAPPAIPQPSQREIQVQSIVASIQEGDAGSGAVSSAFMHALADRVGSDVALPTGAELERVETRTLREADASRTDKQIGLSSNTPGASNLVEKAAIPYLLGLALEHGAIQQDRSATALTLSTTPYLVMYGATDTQYQFEKYHMWRRIGLSTSFAAQKGGEATANDLKTEDVSEITLRLRLLGDRSTRSADFQDCWNAFDQCKYRDDAELRSLRAQASVQPHTNAIGRAANAVQQRECRDSFSRNLANAEEALQRVRGTDEQSLTRRVNEILDASADAMVIEIRTASPGSACLDDFHAEMRTAETSLKGHSQNVSAFVDAYMKKEDLLTFSVSQHPIDGGTDYTDMKLVYDRSLEPLELTINAGVTLNNDPGAGSEAGSGQDVLRDYSVALGLSYRADWNPLRIGSRENNPKPFLLVASGKFAYSEELDDPIGSGQFRVEIPLLNGITIPVAVTYTSRTETQDDDEISVSVGTGLDLDAIAALMRHQ